MVYLNQLYVMGDGVEAYVIIFILSYVVVLEEVRKLELIYFTVKNKKKLVPKWSFVFQKRTVGGNKC